MASTESLYRRSPIWLQTVLLNGHAVRIHRQRYGRAFRELLTRWQESERWEPARLRAWQDERLRQIVRFAYDHVPFYRKRFDARGIKPSDVQGVVDLHRLPVLTRDEVRAASEELTTPDLRRALVHGHTSGTTGSPLSLFYDRAMCVANNVADWRQKRWGGMTPDDWCGMLLGRVIVPTAQSVPPFWRSNYVHRQLWFSCFHMSDRNLELYVREARARGLRFLEGYPSSLYILARHLQQSGERLPMQAVFTSSETLHDVQIDALKAAFDCPIYDFYGLAERVIFAGECECHDGKHVFDEYGVTEIVDDHGQPLPDGTRGWMVGTTLWNRGMPLIRYWTGDISARVPGTCRCGRGLARITGVATKAEDIVVTRDGRFVSPSVLTHPFKPFDQIVKSQIIQEAVDHVTIKLVPSAAFTLAHQHALVAGLRERLGEEVRLAVEVVDEIQNEPSGKFRWVISRVPHPCTLAWGA